MRTVRMSGLAIVAGLAAAAPASVPQAATSGSSGGDDIRQVAEAAPRSFGGAADMLLRFVQEDGPASGRVRVLLTPETRPLTLIEARVAAQDAFLETLKEPGLGEGLKRITVVVYLMPAAHPDPDAASQVIVYQHKGGNDWSVLAGE